MMSYIRCLSNPEGLYVWLDVNGMIAISVGTRKVRYVPFKSFVKFCKKWVKHWDYELEYKGFRTNESKKFKIEFSYKDEFKFEFWDVTWECLCRRIKERESYVKFKSFIYYIRSIKWWFEDLFRTKDDTKINT
jgi:hypothetical protein